MQSDNAINIERLNHVKDLIHDAIRDRRAALHPRPAGDRLVLPRVDRDRRRARQLHGLRRRARRTASAIPSKFRFPRGAILNKNLAEVLPVDLADVAQIRRRSPTPGTPTPPARPRCTRGKASPSRTTRARSRPTSNSTRTTGYSWLKTPRWKGHAMEVGPLARMLIGYASGRADVQGGRRRGPGRAEGARRPRSSRPSAAPPPAAWRPPRAPLAAGRISTRLIDNIKAGDSRPPTPASGTRRPGPRRPRASASPRRRAARSATGSNQGRQDRQLPERGALHLERIAARRQGSARRLRGGPDRHADGRPQAAASKSCAPSTPSTPAWPAPRTSWGPMARRWPKW